jgi:hypothetical protein
MATQPINVGDKLSDNFKVQAVGLDGRPTALIALGDDGQTQRYFPPNKDKATLLEILDYARRSTGASNAQLGVNNKTGSQIIELTYADQAPV